MSIFSQEKASLKLSVSVDGELQKRIEKISTAIAKIDPSKRFDLEPICVKAIRRAVVQAEKELEAVKNNRVTDAQPA